MFFKILTDIIVNI